MVRNHVRRDEKGDVLMTPDLLRSLSVLGPDELRVLELQASRLAMGRGQYGPLEIAGDKRNYLREILLEYIDASQYAAMQLLRLLDGEKTEPAPALYCQEDDG